MSWDEDPLVTERYHISKVKFYEPRTHYFTTAEKNIYVEEKKDDEVSVVASDANDDVDAKEEEISDRQRQIEDVVNQIERADRHPQPDGVAYSIDLEVEAMDPEIPDDDLVEEVDDADVLRDMGVVDPIPVAGRAEPSKLQAKPIPLLTDKGNRIPPDTEQLIREFDLHQFVDGSALHRPQIDVDNENDVPLPPIPGIRKRKREAVSVADKEEKKADDADEAADEAVGNANGMDVEEEQFRGETPSKRQRLRWLTALRSHSRIAPNRKRLNFSIFKGKTKDRSKTLRTINIK